ncbi:MULTISPECIES: SDR family oxidoreductase [Methylobacterium]|jgi:NAD(P)-dependent dehydrogenase (short-subunit alcohol dehydrogenase family)|uniref:SDR family oxidoreductase n=1 Tax=Methylobacterium TaxID=407 RepID=UPI0008E337B7|nr:MULTISPECIES: SDR family oxidoreductase [Methylobacterium]MBZ6412292.1 SDR family oxidoreductase [Methylobacterium sp.]MBK3400632.1 SDR family oxidoreductase [Methylobacterium ajmalii]MBK3410575.1 SDR family oxidoreductase [Methylobacterium ajmalii]MBK3426391.1 SDR family oxidoreductase [Methylobacterium ajmalii]SFE72624.1 NAD(P)-dependent dehydrogenase, short-chain alcohol dehydrogenase family [Methylobacterium sp. yr596]
MEMGLGGLKVLVTAGASGIGLEVAQAFMEEGAQVHVCDVDREALAALPPGIGATHADVASREDVARLFAEAERALGGLDCLVNNAGIAGPTGRVEEIDPEDWDRTLDICLTGQFNCVRLAVPLLRASANPSIVNLSSAAGRFGFPLRTPYAAAKWAVIGFTKSLSRELGADGIRVNAVLPGIVAGDRQRRVLEAKAQQRGIGFSEMESAAFSAASIKEYVTARQLADQILFLASARGKTISGQALAVDGDLQMLT